MTSLILPTETSTPLQTGYYTRFDGTPLYYEVRGSGTPVIFVYGIACLINHWNPQISYFSKMMTVVNYDLRGHHKSNPVQDKRTLRIDHLCDDLITLVEKLNLKSAHFVGHSFGAPILIEAFHKNPKIFKSISFINGFAKNPISGMFGLDVVEPIYKFIHSAYYKNSDLWDTLWKYTVNNQVSMTLAGLLGGFNLNLTHFKDIEVYSRGVAQMELENFFPLFEDLMTYNGIDKLDAINIPTLLISGENDQITPPHFQEELHLKIKGSEFLSVPYGSHCTQLDFPELVNLKLKDFWSELK